jgi:hypothetical protein
MNQLQVITIKLKKGKVKNRYAAKNKIKKLNKIKAWNEWLAR